LKCGYLFEALNRGCRKVVWTPEMPPILGTGTSGELGRRWVARRGP
jgi:hypothetical protein